MRKIKSSEPIPIGSCHTVSGHEAMDLAKRLSEELAAQQQAQRPLSPDEPRAARSFEHGGKHGGGARMKGSYCCRTYFKNILKTYYKLRFPLTTYQNKVFIVFG